VTFQEGYKGLLGSFLWLGAPLFNLSLPSGTTNAQCLLGAGSVAFKSIGPDGLTLRQGNVDPNGQEHSHAPKTISTPGSKPVALAGTIFATVILFTDRCQGRSEYYAETVTRCTDLLPLEAPSDQLSR
jgi:hypothetical protein